ncbi:MAG: hypothetical protein WC121_13860 [Candidatus Kapaibacterium sp.]|jgi:hypothetical protein
MSHQGPGGSDQKGTNPFPAGSVYRIDATVPAFMSVSGGPITSAGTLAFTLSGTPLPLSSGGTGASTASAAFNALSPMTASGDLIYGGASGAGTRLASGTNGQVLTLSGGLPTWQTGASGSGTVTSVAATVPAFLSVAGSPITTSGTLAFTLSGTPLPIANGGTGTTSVPTTAAASTYAAWDANVNLFGNNVLAKATNDNAAGSGATITLTKASTRNHNITNNNSNTYVLPSIATADIGLQFQITKQAGSGTLTVQSAGLTTLDVLSIGQSCTYTATSTTGDSIWLRSRSISTTATTGLPITFGGTGLITLPSAPVASTYAAWTSNANLRSNSFHSGFQSIVTAASTTTLLVTSPQITNLTGSTAGKVLQLPDVTTFSVLGMQYLVKNSSSVPVSITSNSTAPVVTLSSGTGIYLTNVSLTDNTAGGWITI